MKKYHYVYLLINTKPTNNTIFYIGKRSSELSPEKDNKYWSSSNTIKKLIKENGNTFIKKVLKTFSSAEDAIEYEILLHNRLNVNTNKLFYNLSKQTSVRYNTIGTIFIKGKQITSKEYKNSDEKYHTFEKVSVIDKEGNTSSVSIYDERYINGELKHCSFGKVAVLNKDGNYNHISKEEFYKNKDRYKATNLGKVVVIDNGKKVLINKTDERYVSGELEYQHNNKVLCKDKNNNIFYLPKEEYEKSNYVGFNKGKIDGKNNPNSKVIKIFDKNDNVVFTCEGDFKKICKENDLPFISLQRSHYSNGKRIYTTKKGVQEAIKRNKEKYIGWYALEIKNN